ncbi:MAG: DUF4214 domain-containing protein [Pseudomonadota bacterium]
MSIRADIAKIYVGYYGRSPEPAGFNYWIEEAARGFTAQQTAASFSVQEESTDRYPYLSNPNVADPGVFVDAVYQNLFNRDPDPEGRAFWIDELNEARGNPDAVGSMILNIISGAQNTEEFGPDLDIINNKVAVALDWAESTAEIAGFVYEFGSPAEASARDVLDDVDETQASVDAGFAQTDAFIEGGAGQPVNTITLTSGIDSGPAFTGTAGEDQFNATAITLDTGDNLDGGGGVDTLSVQFGNFQSVSATPRLANIENIEVQGGARDLNAAIDLTTSTGVEKLMLQDVNGESTQNFDFKARVVFEGVGNLVDISVVDSSTPNETFTSDPLTDLIVRYDASATSGDGDTQTLSITDSSIDVFDVEGLTNLEVTAEGQNFVAEFDQFERLNVEGAGDLAAGFTSSGTTATFNSTDAAGDMSISFASGQDVVANAGSGDDNFDFSNTANVSVEGGDGDDIFFFDNNSLTEEDSVDGGDGTDTLAVDNDTAAPASIVNEATGIEVLQFQSSFGSLEASEYTQVDEFVFNGGPHSSRVAIRGVESDDRFIFTSDQGFSSTVLRFEGENVGQTLQLELHALEDGTITKDFRTVENGNIEIVANTNSGNDVSAVYIAENIGAVEIASTGFNADANLIEAIDTGSENYYAFNIDEGTSSFSITGDQDLTITAREGVSLTGSSDTLGFSQAVNVNATDFSGDLRIALSNSADVMQGGSGDDVLYTMGGDDIVSGGDGTDQFRYSDNKGTDTILDFLIGEDQIGLSEVDFQNTEETAEGTTLAEEDYVENRNGIDNIGSADDFTLLELQTGLSSNQIENDTGAEVEAYILVYNTTTDRGEIWHDTDWSDDSNRDHIASFDNVSDLAGVQAFSNTDFVEYFF